MTNKELAAQCLIEAANLLNENGISFTGNSKHITLYTSIDSNELSVNLLSKIKLFKSEKDAVIFYFREKYNNIEDKYVITKAAVNLISISIPEKLVTNHEYVYRYNSKGLFSDSFIRKNTIPNKQIVYSGDNVGLAKKYGIKIITNDELNEYNKKIVDNFNKNKEYNINKIMKNIDFAKLQKESNSDKKLTFERIRKSIKLHSNNDDNGSINFYADSDLFDYFFLELNVNDVGKIIGIKCVKD